MPATTDLATEGSLVIAMPLASSAAAKPSSPTINAGESASSSIDAAAIADVITCSGSTGTPAINSIFEATDSGGLVELLVTKKTRAPEA